MHLCITFADTNRLQDFFFVCVKEPFRNYGFWAWAPAQAQFTRMKLRTEGTGFKNTDGS